MATETTSGIPMETSKHLILARRRIWIAVMSIITVALAVSLLELVYTPVSLYRGWATYTSENSGLAGDTVNALTIDRQSRVWVGTYSGVSVFTSDSTWTTYTGKNSGLSNDDVEALAVDGEGQIWVGTYYGGLSLFDPAKGSWTTYTSENSKLSFDFVDSLAVDNQGQMWIGTNCSGSCGALDVVSPGGRWEEYSEVNSYLANYQVNALTVDKQGRIWAGTMSGLNMIATDGTWTTYAVYNSGLANDYVYALAVDGDGRVWVGTSGGGLSVFDPNKGSWKTYTHANSGLAYDDVSALVIDQEGQVWVGTDYGLSVFAQDGMWITYTPGNSTLLGGINALGIDDQGRVWAGGNGLSVFDGHTALPAKVLKQKITVKMAINWNAVTLLGLLLILPAALITKRFAPWAIWFVVTTVGCTVLWVSDLIFADLIVNNYDYQFIIGGFGYVLLTIVGGSLLGLVQWLVLRRWIKRAGWWIAASIATWLLCGFSLFIPRDSGIIAHLVIGAIIGGLAGLPQWLVLNFSTRKAAWWILATAIGWALFTTIGLALVNVLDIAVIAAGAAIASSMTGIALVWLFAQETKEADISPGGVHTPEEAAQILESNPIPDQPNQAHLRRGPRWAAWALVWTVLFALPWLYAGWILFGSVGIPETKIPLNQPVSDFRDKSPTWSPDGRQIAFVSDRESIMRDEVYNMNADGSELTKLTIFGDYLTRAIWSPDGRKIAFFNRKDFYVLDIEQALQDTNVSGITRFAPKIDPCEVAWSPDSQHIVNASCHYPEGEIIVVNPDGSRFTNISNTAGVPGGGPTWSPDGQMIAFWSGRDGNKEIYIMKPDGSGVTNLTHNAADDYNPAWSPDGRQIAFVSSRNDKNEIYVMNADGSEARKLTETSGLGPGPNNAVLAWSPDGQLIAFVIGKIDSPSSQVLELYVTQVNSSMVKKLVDIKPPFYEHETNLAWSSDSRKIAFASDNRIYVIDADGNNLRKLSQP
jgi:Tol biopolymer transport system component/streptogramin lyase